VFDADSRTIREWHGRAGRSIKHPARHLQQLKPAITFERGLNAHCSLSHTGPIGGYLQAKPRVPRVIDLQFGTMGFVSRGCITILARISLWRGTRHFHERSKRQRRARSSQFLKSAGCIIVTDEPHNVGDPVSSVVISIKSMEGLPARAEIDVRCCRSYAPLL
jgi:hypothetical protein